MSKKQVAKKESTAVSTEVNDLFGAHAGSGQATSAKHTSIPYLSIVQAMSDYVKKKSDKYNEHAEIGMFYNSLTKTFLKGDQIIIPVCFKSIYVVLDGAVYPKTRFRKRKMSEAEGAAYVSKLMQEGYAWVDGADYVEEEYEIYMMLLDEAGENVVSRFLVSFASTKLKKARQLNSMTMSKFFDNGKLKPMFAAKYQMKAINETNRSGDEYLNFEFYDHEDVTEPNLAKEAIAFFNAIEGGEAVAKEDTDREVKEDNLV